MIRKSPYLWITDHPVYRAGPDKLIQTNESSLKTVLHESNIHKKTLKINGVSGGILGTL
jgi:hypothetical protein